MEVKIILSDSNISVSKTLLLEMSQYCKQMFEDINPGNDDSVYLMMNEYLFKFLVKLHGEKYNMDYILL